MLSNLSVAQDGVHFDPDFDFTLSRKNISNEVLYKHAYVPQYAVKLSNQLSYTDLNYSLKYSGENSRRGLSRMDQLSYTPRIEGVDKDYYLAYGAMSQDYSIQRTAIQYDGDYANFMLQNQFITPMDLNRCPTEVVLDGAFETIFSLFSKLKK